MIRVVAMMLTVALAPLSGFLEQWIPSIIPPEWVEIAPVNWQKPERQASGLSITDTLEPIDADEATGFLPQRILNDAVGVHARFMLSPADSELNTTTITRITDVIDGQTAATGIKYTPQAHDTISGMGERGCVTGSTFMPLDELLRSPELAPPKGAGVAITCDIMTASDTLFVQRIRTIDTTGETPIDTTQTLITDTVHSSLISTADLWSDAAPELLWSALIDELRHELRGLSRFPAQSEPDLNVMREVLESVIPLRSGSFAVVLPVGFTTPELDDLGFESHETPLVVEIDEATVGQLASDTGRALSRELQSGNSLQRPDTVPAAHRNVDCSLMPCVALTYDDGPTAYTPYVLDALAAHGASASFFLQGTEVEKYAGIARRIVAEGHLALNHTWSHRDLVKLESGEETADDETADKETAGETADGEASETNEDTETGEDTDEPTEKERHEAVKRELGRASDAIAKATGMTPRGFRPPYGELNEEVLKIADQPAFQWDVDSEDWTGISTETLISRVVTQSRPGSIVLQHDVHANTAESLDEIMVGLQQRGFTLVNLEQLFGEMPESGEWFHARP